MDNAFIIEIFENLVKNNLAAFLSNDNRDTIVVYWRSIAEWANVIYEFVENTGQLNIPLTYFELTQGDYSHLSGELCLYWNLHIH